MPIIVMVLLAGVLAWIFGSWGDQIEDGFPYFVVAVCAAIGAAIAVARAESWRASVVGAAIGGLFGWWWIFYMS